MREVTQHVVRAGAGLALLALLLGPADADAQRTIYFEGETAGCFGTGCTPLFSDALDVGGDGNEEMVFRAGTFDGFSSSSLGIFGIGGDCAPIDGPPGTQDNLGCLFLADGDFAPFVVSSPFTLAVNFTAPTITSGDNIFQALLEGEVTGTEEGGVVVDFFDNSPRTFTFTDGIGDFTDGTFTLAIDDTSINPNETVPLTGVIRVEGPAVVPEPSTLILLGSALFGLGGVGFVRRRKEGVRGEE